MRSIQNFVKHIEEELHDAERYAEKYVECKSKDHTMESQKYREMAQDELKHAGYIHDMAVAEIETLKRTFMPTPAMEEKWEKAHKEYVHKAAWIKQMLSM